MTKLKARPTIYKGIQMRSRLEAGLAAWLDKNHFIWEYEPYALATEDGQYLPDFVLTDVFAAWLPDPAKVFVEVKPNSYSVEGRRDLFPETYGLTHATCDLNCLPMETGRIAGWLKEAGKPPRVVHSHDCAIEVETRQIADNYQAIRQQALLVWKAEPTALFVVWRPRGIDLLFRNEAQPGKRVECRARLRQQAARGEEMAIKILDLLADDTDESLAAVIWNDWEEECRLRLTHLPKNRVGFALGEVDGPWKGEYWRPGQ